MTVNNLEVANDSNVGKTMPFAPSRGHQHFHRWYIF